MKQLFANNVSTTLASPLGSTDTTLSVSAVTGFPVPGANEYFLITVQSGTTFEIIQVTAITGTTFTISARAQEGTFAQSFPAGALVEMRVTAGTLLDLEESLTTLPALASLTAPSATTAKGYKVADTLDPSGLPLVLLSAASYAWTPVNYAMYGVDSAATISSTTTLNTVLGVAFQGTNVSGTNYLIQFTSGPYAGQIKVVSALTSSTLTFTPALPSVVTGNTNVILYQYSSLLRVNTSVFEYNGTNGQNVLVLSGNATLLASQSGMDVLGPFSAATITLPPPLAGLKYRIMARGASVVVSTNGGALYFPDSSSSTTWSIPQNSTLELHCGETNWHVVPSGNYVGVTPAQGDVSTRLATTAFVQQAGGNFGGVTPSVTSAVTLDGTAYGRQFQVGASGFTITLPSIHQLGGAIWFYPQAAAGSVSITIQGSDFIYAPTCGLSSGTGPTVLTLNAGENLCLMNRGDNEWDVVAGTWLQNHSTVNPPTNSLNVLGNGTVGGYLTVTGQISAANGTGGQNLLTWNQLTNGSFSPSVGNLTVNGQMVLAGSFQIPTGQQLRFGGVGENTDTTYFLRTNVASDLTKLAVVVGDNGTGATIPAPSGSTGTDYFSVEATDGIHHLFGTDGTYTAAGPINSYGTVSGSNATGGQNFLTWSQSTNGSFSPTYASVTVSGLQVNGNMSVVGSISGSPASSSTQMVTLGQAQSNFAAIAGSSTQVFNVANATTATEAVPLGQLSASSGATLVGYTEGAPVSVFRTVAAKLQESVSVLDFGADPTGATDSTAAIQAAINYLNSLGGGELLFPRGTYVCGQIIVYSNIWIRGTGLNNTTIKLANGTNNDLIYGYGANALWGTNSSGGISNFALFDITLNGNSSNNTAGSCIAVYGFLLQFQNIYVTDAPVYGIRTEWGTGGGSSPFAMEGFYSNVRIDTCGQHGWLNNGPHDAVTVNAIVVDASASATNTYDGFYIGPNMTGRFIGCHAWNRSTSNRHAYALNIAAGGSGNEFVACHFEGAYSANVGIFCSNNNFDSTCQYYSAWNAVNIYMGITATQNVIKGTVNAPGSGRPASIAVVLGGSSGDYIAQNDIDLTCNDQEAGNITFTSYDSGANKIRLNCYNTTAATINGAPNVTDDIEIIGNGYGSGFRINNKKQYTNLYVAASSSVTWTYPYAFPSLPNITFSPSLPSGAITSGIWISSVSTTSVTIYNNNTVSMTLNTMASL